MLAFALASALVQPTKPRANVNHLTISVSRCFAHNELVSLTIMGSAVDVANGRFEVHSRGRADDLARRNFQISVHPGTYMYEVSEVVLDQSAAPTPACSSSQQYVTVLPGRNRSQTVSLTSAISDSLPPILVSGRKPREVTVSMRRLSSNVVCGDRVSPSSSETDLGSVTNDPLAYYAEAFPASEDASERIVLRVDEAKIGGRWVLPTLPTPDPDFNGRPGTLRLDVTPELLKRLRAMPANALACI